MPITSNNTTIRPNPLPCFPPRTQCAIHAKVNAIKAVAAVPAKVRVPWGASGAGRVDCRVGCAVWPRYECVLRSCDATMMYRKRSRNRALSARPSLELTAFYCHVSQISPMFEIICTYRAGLMDSGDCIVVGYGELKRWRDFVSKLGTNCWPASWGKGWA